MFDFLKRKKPEKPKPKRPIRISVHLFDGRTIVHYAHKRTRYESGWLSISDDDGKIAADYAPGVWESVSVGKRCVSDRFKVKNV